MDGVVPQCVLFAERTPNGDEQPTEVNLQAAEARNPIAGMSLRPAGPIVGRVGHELGLALSDEREPLFRVFVPHLLVPRC
jgi:hypothetical protein